MNAKRSENFVQQTPQIAHTVALPGGYFVPIVALLVGELDTEIPSNTRHKLLLSTSGYALRYMTTFDTGIACCRRSISSMALIEIIYELVMQEV